MGKIITFGEIMLRLSPAGCQRLFQNDGMQATFGGAEANVAVSLARFGEQAVFVTKVPDQSVGHASAESLRSQGVDISEIRYGGDRLGIYYYEKGAGPRSSICIYDRTGSAIQTANPEEFDWEKIFYGADWFHITGITPALGGKLIQICKDACEYAKWNGLKISCDLNYRSKLWTQEEACETMSELCQYVDVCIGNEDDAKTVFGIKTENTNTESGILDKKGYEATAQRLAEMFCFDTVAFSLRSSHSASCNDWAGMLYDGKEFYHSKSYHLDHIVDRVGSGDSFAAGLIYGFMKEWSKQKTVDFAVAASALKHSIEGDFNLTSVSEVVKLMESAGTGRIER